MAVLREISQHELLLPQSLGLSLINHSLSELVSNQGLRVKTVVHWRHHLSVAGTLFKPFLGELDGIWVDVWNLFHALLVGVV